MLVGVGTKATNLFFAERIIARTWSKETRGFEKEENIIDMTYFTHYDLFENILSICEA